MALAVCLLFDAAGDRVIRQIWARLESRGIPSPLTHTHGRHRPHLSLVVLRSWDLTAVTAALARLSSGDPLDLSIQGTLAFPRGRAALAVAVNEDLVRRQRAAAVALGATGAELHRHYVPGRWVPHIAIATGGSADRFPAVVRTVNDVLPLTAKIVQAALIDSGTGESWPLPDLP